MTEIGLRRSGAAEVVDALLDQSERTAERVQPVLENAIEYLSGEEYRRRSTMDAVYSELRKALADSAGRLVRRRLAESTQREWETLRQHAATEETFDRVREEANDRFVESMIPEVIQQVEKHLGRTLTDEQARAVATDEDATLVLAGAGSGKTMVILGKIAHLIEQGASPVEILVLAYNRKAKEEVLERLPVQLDAVDVNTFHSFGRRVVSEAEGKEPSLSPLAKDEKRRKKALQGYLQDMLLDPQYTVDLQAFLLNNLGDYKSPFDFESMGDYLDYIRKERLITFNGESVKSFEESEIANFLALNNVQYEYESLYRFDTATSNHRQYKPDFFLPDYDLYIEHFGLDENGQPPADWGKWACKRYLEGVEWKRSIHQQHETTLIETYSWQCSRGHLTATLKHMLLQHGVTLSPRPLDELVEQFKQKGKLTDPFVELVDSFLNHVKTNRTSMIDLQERIQILPDGPGRNRAERFVPIFMDILERYERDVRLDGIDFYDMINLATDYISEDSWRSPYRYILVDEFQDIALNRMKLISELRKPGEAAYFTVGDDWQAINRFAGSDLELMQNAGTHLGAVRERHLLRTFRFGSQLSDVTSTFVKRNPLQSQRVPVPLRDSEELGIFVVAVNRMWKAAADRDQAVANAINTAISEIEDSEGKESTVLLLGRYAFTSPTHPYPRRANIKTEFSTVHSAKGREADFVIILGLNDEKYGFPSRIEDDVLLNLVTLPDEDFEFAEERRLLYVAMTRARKGVFLLTDSVYPSKFVKELLQQSGDSIRVVGELMFDRFPDCPLCRSGVLTKSKSGESLRCVNKGCPGYAVACECGRGFRLVDHTDQPCTEDDCTATYANCPVCQHGIMIHRENNRDKHEFWSCSEWQMTSKQCEWTQNFDPVKYPSWPCPKCTIGVVRAVSGSYGVFWGCNRYRDDPPCNYKSSRKVPTAQAGH